MNIIRKILLILISICSIISISTLIYISAFQKVKIGFVAVEQTVQIRDYKNYNTYADFIEELDFDELMLAYSIEEDSYDYINLAISFDREVNFYNHNHPEYSIDEFLEKFGDQKIQDGALVHFVYYKEIESEQVEIIKYESFEEKDETLDSGSTEIKVEGIDGKTITPKIEVYRNGKLIDTIIGETERIEPVNEIVLVGTKLSRNYSSSSTSSNSSSSHSTTNNSSNDSNNTSPSNEATKPVEKTWYLRVTPFGGTQYVDSTYTSESSCISAGKAWGNSNSGSWGCKDW